MSGKNDSATGQSLLSLFHGLQYKVLDPDVALLACNIIRALEKTDDPFLTVYHTLKESNPPTNKVDSSKAAKQEDAVPSETKDINEELDKSIDYSGPLDDEERDEAFWIVKDKETKEAHKPKDPVAESLDDTVADNAAGKGTKFSDRESFSDEVNQFTVVGRWSNFWVDLADLLETREDGGDIITDDLKDWVRRSSRALREEKKKNA